MSVLLSAVLVAAEHSEHTNPLAPEANEVIWGTVSFIVFFAIMAKYVFPSLNRALEERTANIEGKLDQAARERQEADQLVIAYKQKLQEANVEAGRILEQARVNADRLESELRAKAEEQAARTVERAQETIAAERDRALQSLRDEVGGLVIDLTTRVVGEAMDRERQLRLVDQYINELPASKAGQGNG